jgi:glutathione S-transferase
VIVYAHHLSSHCRKVLLLCEELCIDYEYRDVDLFEGAQRLPQFIELNPNGRVPVIDDDGFVLWESQAILRYLAQREAAWQWYPRDPRSRALVDQWLDWNQTRLGPAVGMMAFNVLYAGDARDESAIAEGYDRLHEILPVLDRALALRAHIAADRATLADIAVAPNIAYLEESGYEVGAYGEIARWFNCMRERPAFARAVRR